MPDTKIMSIKQIEDKKQRLKRIRRNLKRYYPLYLIALPSILWYVVFCYLPMFGIIIAFKDFSPFRGVEGIFTSKFVGFNFFKKFFDSPNFWQAFRNNVIISFMSFGLTYPLQIVLALLLNELRLKMFKRVVQTISYLPYFLSVMVIVSIVTILTDEKGPINSLITSLGGQTTYFLMDPRFFRWIIAISDCWQSVGWGSIMFLAALTSIDPVLYTAASIDGASRFQRLRYISLPGMYSIISITIILNVPSLLGASFEKILLLMNTKTAEVGDVLSTYTYRAGLVQQSYSYSTAVGFFISVLSVMLLLAANKIAKKLGQEGIW